MGSGIFKPRRGKRSTAISKGIILKKGEIFYEVPDTGVGTGAGRVVMGDGVTSYENLPYYDDGSASLIEPIEITKAEYDLLPQADKEAHRYVIMDYPIGELIDLSTDTKSGNSPISFDTSSEQIAREVKIGLVAKQAGSGDPSPTNIREISGYDKIELTVPKKNLFGGIKLADKFVAFGGTINENNKTITYNGNNINGYCIIDGVFEEDTQYTLIIRGYSSGAKINLVWKYSDGTTDNIGAISTVDSPAYYRSDIGKTVVGIYGYYADSADVILYYEDCGIFKGALNASDFESYDPLTDIKYDLPETVYGGTLNVTTGELVVDKVIVDLGNFVYNKVQTHSGPYAFIADLTSKKINGELLFDSYSYIGERNQAWILEYGNNNQAFNLFNEAKIYIIDSRYTDATQFATAVAGQKLVYELATPYTIKLNEQQVALIQGSNTIISSNGTTINITYRNGEIATLEDVCTVKDNIDYSNTTYSDNPIVLKDYYKKLVTGTKITLEPIQVGSGDPSPSNIRAISGYDVVELKSTGKNLYVDSPYFDDYIHANLCTKETEKYNGHDVWSKSSAWNGLLKEIYLTKGIYTFSAMVKTDSNNTPLYMYAKPVVQSDDFNVNPVNKTLEVGTSWTKCSFTFEVVHEGKSHLRVESNTNTKIYISEYQLELGSVTTSYEPYNPITDISDVLPETVYGGTLDVESGELVVDRGIVTFADGGVLAGSLSVSFSGTYIDAIDNAWCIANEEVTNSDSPTIIIKDKHVWWYAGLTATGTANITEFNAWLANHPLQVVYELATPYTIHLTPVQVRLLTTQSVITTNGTTIELSVSNANVASIETVDSVKESVNALGERIDDLFVKVVYTAEEAISISAQESTNIDIAWLIPAEYEPFSVSVQRHIGAGNSTIESALYKDANGWRVKVFNWYTSITSIQPIINIYCIKRNSIPILSY